MNTRLIIGAFIILTGISILFDLNLFKIIFPLLLIWIGVQIILGKDSKSSIHHEKTEVEEDSIRRVLIFSGLNQKVVSNNFTGGEIITIFGGVDLDLTEVKTKEKNLKIDLVAIFGGIQLRVPQNWAVKSAGVGILGGFDNNANGSATKKTAEIEIKGVSILGGVEVMN